MTTATPEAPASTTEETPRWQIERDTHGPESVAQLIGNLTRDAVVEVPEDDKKPYIWGGLAVNRGEDQPATFYTYYIYGVKDNADADESTRVSVEQLEEFASSLVKGQRVKLQGRTDLRPINEELYAEACKAFGVEPGSDASKENKALREFFFAVRPTVRTFINRQELDLENTFDKKGRRPMTLLPAIGGDSSDDGLPFG